MNASVGVLTATVLYSLGTGRYRHMTERPAADEKTLVAEARRGDREAIGVLVERYSHGLFRFLARLAGDSTLAEDLLQDTWLRVMEHLDSYRADQPFGNWLFAIARHRALDVFRQQSRRRPRGSIEGMDDESRTDLLTDPDPSILERLAELDLAAQVFRVMRTLPVTLREVLSLRFEEGLEIDAIARVLGLSSSTVKDRLYRGLDQLRLRTERMTRHERT